MNLFIYNLLGGAVWSGNFLSTLTGIDGFAASEYIFLNYAKPSNNQD